MDRLKLLEMALNSASTPQEALALAREMAAFLAGPEEAKPVSAPEKAPQTPPLLVHMQTRFPDETRAAPPNPPAPARARIRPKQALRQNCAWTQDEEKRAAELLDAGKTYEEVGDALGRTRAGVLKRRVSGRLPVKTHTLDLGARWGGVMAALGRGQAISQAVEEAILAAAAEKKKH